MLHLGKDGRLLLDLPDFQRSRDARVELFSIQCTTCGTKLKVLELLQKHDVTTTILPAVAKNHNDVEVGDLLNLVLSRPNLCSLELHPLTFTGQGGVGFVEAVQYQSAINGRCGEPTSGPTRQRRHSQPGPPSWWSIRTALRRVKNV